MHEEGATRAWRRITDLERREIIRLLKTGKSPAEVAAAVGRSLSLIYKLMNELGGIFRLEEPRSPLRLSLDERGEIYDELRAGKSIRHIARQLNRAASTISRELNANGGRDHYRPWAAEDRAARKRLRPRLFKLLTDLPLHAAVQQGLKMKWSPEQISARLVQDFPDEPAMRVSPETIYQALFVQSRGTFRQELTAELRSGRTRRRVGPKALDGRGQLPGMINISERPADANDRAVPGHWEGDLILGKDNKSAIGTLVERWSRFVMLLHLPDGHGADQVLEALTAKILTLPEALRRSLTWDQGKEMARHLDFTVATDVTVYFCDPHSPWQRGTNENTNGLLRQYFPKGTNLSVHSAEYLDFVADEMNGRPRQTLNWRTPGEKLAQTVAMAV